jgi:nicotinamidase-related amidase
MELFSGHIRLEDKSELFCKRPRMLMSVIRLRPERILIDIDTQKDFFLRSSRARIRNHGRVLANIRRVAAWARLRNIPMISTVQIYFNRNPQRYFCIAGTKGQEKIRYTLRNSRTSFAAGDCTDVPQDILRQYDQVILHKRCFDPFEEPRSDRVLTELRADEFILIGVAAEDAVKATALGLLARRKNVTLLVDAVVSHNRSQMHVALQNMWAKGIKFIDSKKLVGTSHLQLVGLCRCDCCRARVRTPSANKIIPRYASNGIGSSDSVEHWRLASMDS